MNHQRETMQRKCERKYRIFNTHYPCRLRVLVYNLINSRNNNKNTKIFGSNQDKLMFTIC